jgi:hypothetical protein
MGGESVDILSNYYLLKKGSSLRENYFYYYNLFINASPLN